MLCIMYVCVSSADDVAVVEVSPDSELSTEGLYARRPSMTTNLLNLRLLANSTGSLATDDDTMETRRQSLISIGSDSLEHPPQVTSPSLVVLVQGII